MQDPNSVLRAQRMGLAPVDPYSQSIVNHARAQPQGGAAGGGLHPYAQNALDLTAGRSQAILDDPRINAANQAFQDVVSGKNLPMGADTVARIQGQQADGRAHAQQSQDQMMQRQLAASGGSIYDPSYQAAQRESTAQRQLGNAGDARQLAIQAAMENFQAQQQAAGSLGQMRGSQYGLGNSLAMAGAEGYANMYDAATRPAVNSFSSYLQPQQQQPQRSGGAGNYLRPGPSAQRSAPQTASVSQQSSWTPQHEQDLRRLLYDPQQGAAAGGTISGGVVQPRP